VNQLDPRPLQRDTLADANPPLSGNEIALYIRLFVAINNKTSYIGRMLLLSLLGEQIATKRKTLGLTQPMLAKKARVGLSTLDALENGRLGELGYSKITNILTALGMELKLQEASAGRPTLDELMEEGRDDQGLDRRR
jgi:hypothetical protein